LPTETYLTNRKGATGYSEQRLLSLVVGLENLVRQQNRIHHVNHSVRLIHVGD